MTDPKRSEISEVREVAWPSIPPSHRVPRRPPAAVTGARGGNALLVSFVAAPSCVIDGSAQVWVVVVIYHYAPYVAIGIMCRA